MLQKFLISLVIDAAFDLILEYAAKLAKKSDTDIDDNAVEKLKSGKKLIVGAIQGKVAL